MRSDENICSPFDAFSASAGRHAERPFLRAPAITSTEHNFADVTWTYGSAAEEVLRLQSLYTGCRLTPGARVALAFDHPVDVYLHLLALNGLGMSVVPLNMSGSDSEVGYVISHSDSTLVVSAEVHVERLQRMVEGVTGCSTVTPTGLASRTAIDTTPLPGDPGREAAVLYTSGTTGLPKGCMLSNDYFLTMGRWYNGLFGGAAPDSHDRLLTPLPPNHMNALCVSFMAMLLCGGCVIQLDRFHPSVWWDTVRDEGATIVHYLGVMPAILLSLPACGDEGFGTQIKFGFGAGSDPRHQGRFEQRFGFPLLEAWAMTETGAGAAIVADCEPRHVGQRCIGRPSPDIEYRLVDESDEDVGAGEPGELLVRRRGTHPRQGFFDGYYKDEEATLEAWRDGWFHTGDVVREGPDGSLFFVDRRKNVIRRSGENISAVEVEATLLSHPDVANCAVTAVPDEMRGDEVFAFIVPAADAGRGQVAAQAVLEHCLDHLSYFKVPRYVAYVDELPLTSSQKVSRAEVKSAARARLDAAACFDFHSIKRNRKAG